MMRLLSLAGLALVLGIVTQGQTPAPAPSSASFSQELFDAHNKYRAAAGVPALVWSDDVAAAAQSWANTLNSTLQFGHDPSAQNQGENLWIGTNGAFSLTQMVGDWGSEQQYFQNGTFPNVSTTGNWSDVGHYSQIVWRNTTSVGCAGVAGSDANYRLVCRYAPPGNVTGQQVY